MLRVSNTFYSCAIALLSPFRPFALTTVRIIHRSTIRSGTIATSRMFYRSTRRPWPRAASSFRSTNQLPVHSMHGLSPAVLVHRLSATNERQFGARSGEFWRLMNEFRLQPKRSRRTS